MKTQYRLATLLVLGLGGMASATESNRVPDEIPLLTGKAVARATDGEDATVGWTIALTLPGDTWRAIRGVMPKFDWPELTWEEVRPGFRDGTMNLSGKMMPKWFKVVDMKGTELERDQIVELLTTGQTISVFASGRMPGSCYRQLPTPAKAIVLLGPGDNQDLAEAKTPAVETAAIAPTGLTIVVCDSANDVLDTLVVPGEMKNGDFEFTVPEDIDEIRVFAVGNRIVGVGGPGGILNPQLRKTISEGLTKNYFVARSKERGGLGFVLAEIEQGVLNGMSAGEAPRPLNLTGEMRKQIREDIAAGKRAPIIYRHETDESGRGFIRVPAD